LNAANALSISPEKRIRVIFSFSAIPNLLLFERLTAAWTLDGFFFHYHGSATGAPSKTHLANIAER
jgi:hypothetical protein